MLLVFVRFFALFSHVCIVLSYFIFDGLLSKINLDGWMVLDHPCCPRRVIKLFMLCGKIKFIVYNYPDCA